MYKSSLKQKISDEKLIHISYSQVKGNLQSKMISGFKISLPSISSCFSRTHRPLSSYLYYYNILRTMYYEYLLKKQIINRRNKQKKAKKTE